MSQPIEDYALLGDTKSAALVSLDGSIDWLCVPRFDSGACFASLLGGRENGRWSVTPVEPHRSERRYLSGTMVLETTHRTSSGTVTVTDVLVPIDDHHRVLRLVEGQTGHVRVRSDLRIRFDYGSIEPWIVRRDHRVHATAGPDALVLHTPIPHDVEGGAVGAEFDVRAGERIGFDLAWHPSEQPAPPALDVAATIEATAAWWRDWSSVITYEGRYEDEVRRSLLVLKALTHAPTGAIVAAPTTSLPEMLGGPRNWDYRYCWLRDSTFTLLALLEVGCVAEAIAWRDWLVRSVAGDPSKVQIMYGIAGERRITETELGWLAGYEGSRPVRIGNAAHRQVQLDVFGEVMDTLHHARERGIEPNDVAWSVQRRMLEWLEEHWEEPDQGLWEVRSGPAQFTFSKVMAWLAFERSVRAVRSAGMPGDADRWAGIRDDIHARVCAEAVDDRGVFTQAFGSSALDASCLVIPLVGFLPPDDPRVVRTVEAVRSELTVDGLVRRYLPQHTDDGVGGDEGVFLLCSFWLADCLALMGRRAEAEQLFDRLLTLRNDVGLLAEQYDPAARRQLGNFPQAFSHVALVSTAITLSPTRPGPSERRSEAGRSSSRRGHGTPGVR